ncbi:hydroquinone glucosyltransferase isoform X3 [Medicago truncatula]|uniref:hydroquinone glucosyltransferase isoform X3 n=1 Tax=Medicago truncatula TaxID=3880 RepID=UPI001967CC29|nr:hydroquinone glucosyltransferase isoform X3 [Medicago truncatula]
MSEICSSHHVWLLFIVLKLVKHIHNVNFAEHVEVVVPGVGYSHLVSILQFSKRLVQLHPNFHVTCFIPSLGSLPTDSKTILQTLPSNISCTFLPPVNSNDLPQGIALVLQLQLTLTHSLPSIHQALKSLTLKTPFVALVVDISAMDALDFAKEFNLLSYVYYPASATSLSSYFYLLKLDKETSCEYRDLPGPIQIPGFLERTKEQGMVIPSWAPQIQILRHSSVGGFLTHCGWNSMLESVLHGVPLITWPLFAEQRTNAVLLSEGLKVGLRPKINQNGIVEKVQIAELIKCLMEGEEGGKLRKNMKELKESANSAHKDDGSATKTLSQLVLKWRNFGIEKQV